MTHRPDTAGSRGDKLKVSVLRHGTPYVVAFVSDGCELTSYELFAGRAPAGRCML